MVVLKEVNNMFWALTLEAGKRYTQTVEKDFHLSMAALEETNKKQDGSAIVSVLVATDKGEFIICSLRHKTYFNQSLDLNFTEGEQVTFFINGDGTVHLTGYQLEDERDQFDDLDDLVDDSDEEEVPELVPMKGSKRKSPAVVEKAKKMKLTKRIESDDDDDGGEDDDFDDDDDEYNSFIDDEALDGDEDDDDFEMEDDDDDDEEEEVKPKQKSQKKEALKQQTPKSEKKGKNMKEESKTPVQEKKTPQTPSNNVQPGGDATESTEKKKKKKKKKKNKNQASPEQSSRSSYRRYSQEAMTAALKKIQETGARPYPVAQEFGVPESSLRDRLKMLRKGKTDDESQYFLFSKEEESRFVDRLKHNGQGYSRSKIIEMAHEYAVSLGKRDMDHPMSFKWYYGFVARWPEVKLLTIKKPRPVPKTEINIV